jgi:hypothetical protein
MTVKKREVPFNKWSFVDRNDLDTQHWYIRLTGGKYHDVIYRYLKISLNMDAQSINFDYEVIEYPTTDNPHGEPQFTDAVGDILKSILDDATLQQDYVIGPKEKKDEDTLRIV